MLQHLFLLVGLFVSLFGVFCCLDVEQQYELWAEDRLVKELLKGLVKLWWQLLPLY